MCDVFLADSDDDLLMTRDVRKSRQKVPHTQHTYRLPYFKLIKKFYL